MPTLHLAVAVQMANEAATVAGMDPQASEQAVADCRRAILADPDNIAAGDGVGAGLLLQGDIAGAEAALAQTDERLPGSALVAGAGSLLIDGGATALYDGRL